MIINKMSKLLASVLAICFIVAAMPAHVFGEEYHEAETVEAFEEITVGNEVHVEQFVNSVNYIYIESPYLQTPETQRIVFSLGEKLNDDDYTLTVNVEDPLGNIDEWGVSEKNDGQFLFERAFDETSISGIYRIISLNISNGASSQVLTIDEMGLDARFGVNEKYEGIEELEPVAAPEENPEAEISVVTLDNNENTSKIQSDIVSALGTAAADTGVEVQMYSEPVVASARSGAGSSGKVIVALDPGHDANDAGASANGLREEVLTLKIANYAKAELETYGGVSVYMTRTTAACPYNCSSAGECIAQRAQAAANAGANIYVSIHLNSSVSSAANGAEVLVPNRNWKPEVGIAGENLANKILDQLTALGLSDRGIYSKDTTINEKYPDGSLSDYFSVMIYNKENGIPGIIVEHAFLSNTGDAGKYLSTESGLKSLGVADATGIAKYFGLSKGSWVWNNTAGTWRWKGSDGSYKTNYWIYDKGGHWYYLDFDGNMVTGWTTVDGNKFYMNESDGVYGPAGSLLTGWLKLDNIWYYLDYNKGLLTGWYMVDNEWYYADSNGKMQTGWLQLGNNKYYLASNGKMVTGVQVIDGKDYLFNSSGELVESGWGQMNGKWYYFLSVNEKAKGWLELDDEKYYLDPVTGERKSGWLYLEEIWYYFDGNGKMLIGWVKTDNSWYYLDDEGKMKTGWIQVDGQTYYLDGSGRMLTGEQIINGKKYVFDSSGALISSSEIIKNGWILENNIWYFYNNNIKSTGWLLNGNKWYYLNGSGAMQTGWVLVGNKWYYLDESGAMQTDWVLVGNKWYYLDESGAMQTDWILLGKNWYYLDGNGAMQTGWILLGKNWYYLDESGAMQTDWILLGKNWYYLDESGTMQTGWILLGKNWYYLDQSGAMQTGWLEENGKKYYLDDSGKMLTGEHEIDGIKYIFDTAGALLKIEKEKNGWKFEQDSWYYYQDDVKKTGWLSDNDKWYFLDGSGVMQTGWILDGNTWYYMNESGAMQTDWVHDGKSWYYMNESGAMQTGWIFDEGTWYYLNGSGAMQTGWLTVGGQTYYLKSNGEMCTGWYYVSSKWYYFNDNGYLVQNQNLPTNFYTIVSKDILSENEKESMSAKMVERYKSSNAVYPSEVLNKGGAETIEDFCEIIINEAQAEGIKPEVVYAQIMVETGWLKFGGDVKIEQFNFAGLGATGNGVSGNSFEDVATGIRAQVQHLKAYASYEKLNQKQVDERFGYVKRYSAPFVEWLGQKENPAGLGWAAGEKYGSKLLAVINSL